MTGFKWNKIAEPVQRTALASIIICGTIMLTSWTILPQVSHPGQLSIHRSALTFSLVPLLAGIVCWLMAEFDKNFSEYCHCMFNDVFRIIYGVALFVSLFYLGVILVHGQGYLAGLSILQT